MDIHGTLATELPQPLQLFHNYSKDSSKRRASSAQTTTRSAVVIIILGGYNNGLRASGLAERIRAIKSIADRELTERLPHRGLKFSHENIPLDIRWNLLEKWFFCIENKLFLHFLNTLLHYRTIKLVTIFKNLK